MEHDIIVLGNMYIAELWGDASMRKQIDVYEDVLRSRYPKEFKQIILTASNLALGNEGKGNH